MKKTIFYLVLAISAHLFFNASCSKEDVDDRDAFVGTWQVSESWTNSWGSGTDNYNMTITKSSSVSNGIVISNFGGVGYTAQATVSGNSLNIPTQISDGDTFSGTGSRNGNAMNFNYTVVDGWTGNCNATKL